MRSLYLHYHERPASACLHSEQTLALSFINRLLGIADL